MNCRSVAICFADHLEPRLGLLWPACWLRSTLHGRTASGRMTSRLRCKARTLRHQVDKCCRAESLKHRTSERSGVRRRCRWTVWVRLLTLLMFCSRLLKTSVLNLTLIDSTITALRLLIRIAYETGSTECLSASSDLPNGQPTLFPSGINNSVPQDVQASPASGTN